MRMKLKLRRSDEQLLTRDSITNQNMSDDEADPELLELLRQSLGIGGPKTDEISTDTGTFWADV